MGRPRKPVDALGVVELASKSLTQEEIAAYFGVSEDTISRNFADEVERGRKLCNSSLRRKQYDVAMKGEVRMLIFLGQQRLEQHDKSEAPSLSLNVQIVNLIDRPNRNLQAIPEAAGVPPIAGEV
jgi:transcriptional regulator with XRE-family HTH domain